MSTRPTDLSDTGVMSTRQRWLAAIGGCIAVAAIGILLVGLLGWDRTNTYLGVPAALAALCGLGLAVYPLVTKREAPGNGTDHRTTARQWAKARRQAVVVQVGASKSTDQHADAAGHAKILQYGAPPSGHGQGRDGTRPH